jgi:transposase-like protein
VRCPVFFLGGLVEKKRRRQWTLAQKLEIIQEADGSSVAAVVAKHGVHSNTIYRWKRSLNRSRLSASRTAKPAVAMPAPQAQAASADYVAFLEGRLAAQLVEIERLRFQLR